MARRRAQQSAASQDCTAPPTLTIGGDTAQANFLTGDITEVKLFDGPLTADDVSAVEGELACKYGIGPAVPARAPTDFSAAPGDHQATLTWSQVVEATSYIVSWSSTPGGPFMKIASGLTTTSFTAPHAIPGQANYYKVAAFNSCGIGIESTVAEALVPMQDLRIRAEGGNLTLSWPDWATTWGLDCSGSLELDSWSPVPTDPVANEGMLELTEPIAPAKKFFRLSSPQP